MLPYFICLKNYPVLSWVLLLFKARTLMPEHRNSFYMTLNFFFLKLIIHFKFQCIIWIKIQQKVFDKPKPAMSSLKKKNVLKLQRYFLKRHFLGLCSVWHGFPWEKMTKKGKRELKRSFSLAPSFLKTNTIDELTDFLARTCASEWPDVSRSKSPTMSPKNATLFEVWTRS